MAKPSEKLAESLNILRELQEQGSVAIQANMLSRTHRVRLVDNGFLQEVMKGWYIPSQPQDQRGESTAWYTSFWGFCASYLGQRFGDDWCLSPEQSLLLHADNWMVPTQLLIRSPKGNNKVTVLPHNTSLFDTRYNMPHSNETVDLNGLHAYALNAALVYCMPKAFKQIPIEIKACLMSISDSSEILGMLLDEGRSTVAGRLAGAFRHIGHDEIAEDILQSMRAAGYDVRETDPFADTATSILTKRDAEPHVACLKLLWDEMRGSIADQLPVSRKKTSVASYVKQIEKNYVTDAYHSLSIEGYRVSPDLIQRVQDGKWRPEENQDDKNMKDALAARGYWQAFKKVEQSIKKVLKKENPGKVVKNDHRIWYREMFSPSVAAGIIKASSLAGYRSAPVYIRHSKHIPPSHSSVRDLMPVLFELLEKETDPGVRIILGHFFFVYIHPYMDGNGRIGRFLMNVMVAAADYPWLVVPFEKRSDYMSSLEAASVKKDIQPFRDLILSLLMK